MDGRLRLVAACAFGLEAVVQRELVGLGYEDAKPYATGRVAFEGDAEAIAKANLWLRSADRVMVRLAEFDSPDFDALYDGVRAQRWRDWFPIDATLPVKARSRASALSSVPAVQRTVKKALVETMLGGQDGRLPEIGPEYPVHVAIENDRAALMLDSTGVGLHKRGYRDLAAAAQLRETLAAALVQLSFFRPGMPLIDPFCGSGTIPIEAAMIAANIAPGLNRPFTSQYWPTLPDGMFDRLRREAHDAINADVEPTISGTDVDPDVLSLARRHATRAGVDHLVHLQQRDAIDLRAKRRFGVVVTNPPYGQRLGELRELDALYQSLPGALARLETWSHFVFTAYPDLERTFRRRADRRRKLYNGRIECTYYQFFGPKPPKDGQEYVEVAPAFGALGESVEKQAELFGVTLGRRVRHLRKWPDRGITCYRLYEKNLPEVPLVIDRYEDRLHIVELERPHERDPGQHARWLERMATVAGRVCDVPMHRVHFKTKLRQRGLSQHEKRGETKHQLTAHEGDLMFLVNLDDYVDTGLFLDHRELRAMVRGRAKDKRVLNLFCYTGSFTVYAADGGASHTTSVDLSNTYLDWAEKNLQLNGLDGDHHDLVRDDALAFVRSMPARPTYDLAVVDPPTFSNSKRTEQDWITQRDHAELLLTLRHLIAPSGVVYFSTNNRKFKLDELAISSRYRIREISKRTVPEDFRNTRIHRAWELLPIEPTGSDQA